MYFVEVNLGVSDLLKRAIEGIGDAASWEIAERGITSISVALVSRDADPFLRSWGHADIARRVPATPGLVYRAGSITKLLTDLAVMRLTEDGKLDLDVPVTRYLPDFSPENPFGGAITLRHLMTHRGGLVRESPRGHYFDMAATGQADAVASLNQTSLVAAPGSLSKYSNAAIGVVGEVVARIAGKPFVAALRDLVLDPAGMIDSRFDGEPLPGRLAEAQMASFDGPRFPAPVFELGLTAAGSIYSTAGDMGRFVRAILDGGAGPGGRIVQPETLEAMFVPHGGAADAGRGIGFSMGDLDGRRLVGHGGEIYGFTSQLLALPDEGFGVAVLTTLDMSPSADRIARFALQSLIALRDGTERPAYFRTTAIEGAAARRLTGHFTGPDSTMELRVFEDRLVIDAPDCAGEIRTDGQRHYIDDAQLFAGELELAPDGNMLSFGGQHYRRARRGSRPAPPAPDFAALVGEYGWEHGYLRIYERDGRPWARTEWNDYSPLVRIDFDRYRFASGKALYAHEILDFTRGPSGEAVAVSLNGIRFPRRDFGAEVEAFIKASARSHGPELRRDAMAAAPPPEPPALRRSDMVSITRVAPGLRVDSLYARTDNFMGMAFYDRDEAWLQRPAAEALERANRALEPLGFGILVYDGYRPWHVTRMFWDGTPPESRMFVSDPATTSRHNRGAAVDLTMVELATGKPVMMAARFDEFSSRSYTNYIGGTDEQRWLRDTLRDAIEAEGFDIYPQEWWHFDLRGWRDYPLCNLPHSALEAESG